MTNKKQTAVEWFHKETWKLKIQKERKEISLGEYAVDYFDLLEQAKAMEKEQKQKLETCLRHCLLMLVQTKAHREMLNLTGGDIFLDSTINQIKELINYEQ